MIAEARAHLAETLSGLGVPVHAYPPGTLAPPVIAILPADPYWEGLALGGAHRITLRAHILATNLQSLDDLLDRAVVALITAGMPPEPLAPPDSDADTGVLSAQITVPLTWTP